MLRCIKEWISLNTIYTDIRLCVMCISKLIYQIIGIQSKLLLKFSGSAALCGFYFALDVGCINLSLGLM